MRRLLWLLTAAALPAGPLAAPAAAQADKGAVTVRLAPVRGSGVSGTAILRADDRDDDGDGETNFAVTLNAADRARRGREFDVWVRAGTCAAPGRKVADLDEVDGDGETEDEDEGIALAELLRSDHILEVRAEDGDEVVACGAIRR
jgi:hypothetical protein